MPYADQLVGLESLVHSTLAEHVAVDAWLPVVSGPESGFRNKAKLVVGGLRGAPTVGILDGGGRGVDLRHCGLYEPGLAEAVPTVAEVVAALGLTPYDVPTRNGELKHVIVTHSPDDELMLRFVLRSPGQLPRIRDGMDTITSVLPTTRVVSVNLQPDHKAVLEGEEEVVLTAADTLPMQVGEVTLHLRPRSFFQTNTGVAAALYAQARTWVEELGPRRVWDLYCGVGGFALNAGAADRVTGVELSADAVESARRSAESVSGTTEFVFQAGDAAAFAAGAQSDDRPDLVVVNPPRRGIGTLADTLERGTARHVLYSSCNVESLARDLSRMPSLAVRAARPFAMFPQTRHHEVLVLLERRG
jgi:23S rRNA (uracil747-C5)-methyltransferase